MFKEIPTKSRYGYVRVSSQSQKENSSIETQKDELIRNGIPEENIRIEVASATDSIKNRPIFQKLIDEELKQNDLIMVTKLDRCSQNTLSFLKLQEKLAKQNITFVALDLPMSDDLAITKLITSTIVAIATFENDRRKERQRQGIEAAKKAGKYKGRKTVITPSLIKKVQKLKEESKLSVTEIAKITGKGRTTIYKVLKQELGYNLSNRLTKKED